jgi:hypothetical protein
VISGDNIVTKRWGAVIGVNARPDEVSSFLLKVPRLSSNLKIVSEDEGANRFRLSWAPNFNPEGAYCFDVSISYESNLCDLHITPAGTEDSKKISNVVASMIEAVSLHGGIRIGEVRDYTQEEQESPKDAEIEKVATYLHEHGLANLEQISSSLGMEPVTASLSLHRLIDKGIIGCTRIGTNPIRLFYYK